MNKKKILFVASIPNHIKAFHLPYLQWFKDNGYETHIATNGPLWILVGVFMVRIILRHFFN